MSVIMIKIDELIVVGNDVVDFREKRSFVLRLFHIRVGLLAAISTGYFG